MTYQLLLQGDQLGVNLQVDDHPSYFLLELLAEFCFPILKMTPDLIDILLSPVLLVTL